MDGRDLASVRAHGYVVASLMTGVDALYGRISEWTYGENLGMILRK